MTIRLQREKFDAAAEVQRLARGRSDIGAVVTFTGLCRGEENGEPIAALTLEHYPGMAEAEIARHVEAATSRWSLLGVTVIHRHGRITPGEDIVLVVTASSHRHDAFAAAEFLMDYLKTRAPFWKQVEFLADCKTSERKNWVGAKAADDSAAERWTPTPPGATRPNDGMIATAARARPPRKREMNAMIRSLIAPALVLAAAVTTSEAAQVSFYQLPSGSSPHDVAAAADGTVWYSGQGQGIAGHFDPATGKLEKIPLGPGAAPHGVIIGPDGAPWFTEGGQNAIARVDPAPRRSISGACRRNSPAPTSTPRRSTSAA